MFGEMNVIRELATKYSKPQLARMVQMGELEPQKAVMAGMMIDRIAKSAMQPPQTTVAQDVLNTQPQMAQAPQMPPQMPQQPAPQMAAGGGLMGTMPHSHGVTALHSGLHDMAGGGIVAFADGGDVPSFAGDRGSFIDPEFRTKDPQKIKQAKFNILADELKNEQELARKSEGQDKLRALSNIQAIQREMRAIRPATDINAGIGALIPSAQAATPMAAKAPAPTAPDAEEEASYDPMTGLKISGPEPKPYNPQLKPGTVYEPNPIRDILQGSPGGARPAPAAAPKPAAPPAPKPPVKMDIPEKEGNPFAPPSEVPEEKIQRPAAIQAEHIPVPSETDFGKEYGDMQSAYKQAGVDVDMYKNMMSELDTKKAGFAKKKEQALGAAMLAFGLDLAGARQGQVFQQMSTGGQKALGMYMNNMDKIAENEDKLDNLKSQLRMAENNFKRTGADSALAQVRARKERIDQIEAKNAEMKQRAAEHQATVAASVYHADITAKTQREVAGSQMAARMAAAQATAGRAGMLTDKQKFDIKQQIQATLEPKLREQYKNNPNAERIIQKKLDEEFLKQINSLRSTPSGYGGAPQEKDMFADWSVEGM
jgi:hypothetical protein